jgi:hypothetical protein
MNKNKSRSIIGEIDYSLIKDKSELNYLPYSFINGKMRIQMNYFIFNDRYMEPFSGRIVNFYLGNYVYLTSEIIKIF